MKIEASQRCSTCTKEVFAAVLLFTKVIESNLKLILKNIGWLKTMDSLMVIAVFKVLMLHSQLLYVHL
jgi:hypothetical protein